MIWFKYAKKKNGFSLIELMVVASIIGILSTLGLTAFTTSQSRARDSKRQEDTQNIMKALELIYAKDGSYPNFHDNCSGLTDLDSYFPQGIPVDPKTKVGYGCWGNSATSPTAFCVEAVGIENQDRANCDIDCDPCAVTGCTSDDGRYCVWSSQE